MVARGADYRATYEGFTWQVPARFNMGVAVCDRHAAASPDRTALIVEAEDGRTATYSFDDIRKLSNRLAHALIGSGLKPGDRMGILLSQSVETAVAHVAAWKAGLISIPLFTLFGEEALLFRLTDSGAKALITDHANLGKIEALRDRLPELGVVFCADPIPEGAGMVDLWKALDRARDDFTPRDTAAEAPGLIVYTSGTTGNPKGALHAHRTLIGHLPGIEMPHEFYPQPGDLFWTPADWAWIGGLMNVLMGAWHHGVPVLAHRAKKYDPEDALKRMARHGVRNSFMPPTALKLMRQVPNAAQLGARPRSVAVAGEPMGAELLEWGRAALGVTLNEFYGQTECNLVVSNCAALMPVKPGAMGRAVPGHVVEIIDDAGHVLPPGAKGQIAVRRPDPVMMLEYWNNPKGTAAKYRGDWLLTGDEGWKDDEGYLWFVGRDDDVITSAGYRIGPSEIEDCLIKHPAVSLAAAIGVPDPVRTEAVKVFVVLAPGHRPSPALEEDIRAFVKTRLSPHEYPRHIEFRDSLPLTATGKIRRKELRDAERAKGG